MYNLYIENLLHTFNKAAKTEEHKTIIIEVQNIMHVFHLLNLRFKKIIAIPIIMSDNRKILEPNQNKCAVTKSNTNQ
jgi:hypothetical protein